MALLAQGFDPSGYTPSYAVANAANEQLFQNQQQSLNSISQSIGDYAKQQKDLAQKDKEMAAKIKGTMSLLDNAKALYPDFAQQIDSTKTQLSDPSLSNLDKIGIAGQVENSLNMMTAKGTEGIRTSLQIEEMQQKERLAGMGGGSAPSYEMKKASIPTPEGNIEMELPYDARTGRFYDQNSMQPIKDLNKWYNQEPGWEAGSEPTSYVNPSGVKATAFGQPEYDPTTKQEIANGRMAQVGGDPSIGSSGMRYRGLESDLPTVATKDFPAGSVLNIKSNLFPQGRQFQVAGTGPKGGVLDFYASNKQDYDRLANQQINGIELVNQEQPQTPQGAISSAASMSRPVTQEEQARAIQIAAEGIDRATASNGVAATPATGDAVPVGEQAAQPRRTPRMGGKLVLSEEQKQAKAANAEITALRQTLDGYGVKIPEAMREGILSARETNDPDQLKAYSQTLKGMADAAEKTSTAMAPSLAEVRRKEEAAAKAKEIEIVQGDLSRGVIMRNIDDARKIINKNPTGGFYNAVSRGISGYYPQSDQARLNDVVGALKATSRFGELQKLRSASPTGASGIGAATEAEGKALEQKATTIRASGSPEDLQKDLSRYQTDLFDTVHGSRDRRVDMLRRGVITVEQFNKAESDYPKPDLYKQSDISILDEETKNLNKKY